MQETTRKAVHRIMTIMQTVQNKHEPKACANGRGFIDEKIGLRK